MVPSARAALSFGGRLLRIGRWSLLLLLLLLFPLNFAVEYTAQPEFCHSCHIMDPYYDSWQESRHSDVDCVECHYAPGLRETVWTKFQALSQVASYVTATASSRPFAKVEDASCLRSGCHSREALEAPVAFGNTRFAHGPHFEASSPGKKLRCSTCHTQTTRDHHMQVDEGTCFLCHFKGQPLGQPRGGCTACHQVPAKIVEHEGLSFDHLTVTARGMACADCHRDVTGHGGGVTRVRCLSCHSGPEDLAHFELALADPAEADRLHRVHVSDGNVDCRACHEDLSHGRTVIRPQSGGACISCHASGHAPQEAFLAGRAGEDLSSPPSLMGHIGVSCESCHLGHGVNGGGRNVTCTPCHKAGITRMLESWMGLLARCDETLRKNLDLATPSLGTGADPSRAALNRARSRIDAVKRAGGAHNILLSQTAFRAAQTDIEEALKAAGLTADLVPLGLPGASTDCQACHAEAATLDVFLGDLPFHHGPHLKTANMQCTDCHEAARPHGRLQISQELCAECHHDREEGDCTLCHRAASDFLHGRGGYGLPDKPDPMAAKVPCIACHTDRSNPDQLAVVRPTCIECHDDSYGPMLDRWLSEAHSLLTSLDEPLAQARLLVLEADRQLPGFPEAHRLLAEAESNLRLLRTGRAVHNPAYARALADETLRIVERIRTLLESQG